MTDIHELRIADAAYPPLLAAIHDPPPRLYVRGNVDALVLPKMVAVVGTRMPTRYGEQATHLLAGGVAAAGATIVSGLALGIDAIAHASALSAKAKTVAVLAGGVDAQSVAPRTNAPLAERIIATGGALVSEYPPGSAPQKHCFIARNRIIAGLCGATLIVEAPSKSGALATADFAMESGREVFAVPGPITSLKSGGTNALLASGAIPALSLETVLAMLGLTSPVAAATETPSGLSGRIIAALKGGERVPDDLAIALGANPRKILAALATLEVSGAVVSDGIRYRIR
jgi:DNA processing protein